MARTPKIIQSPVAVSGYSAKFNGPDGNGIRIKGLEDLEKRVAALEAIVNRPRSGGDIVVEMPPFDAL